MQAPKPDPLPHPFLPWTLFLSVTGGLLYLQNHFVGFTGGSNAGPVPELTSYLIYGDLIIAVIIRIFAVPLALRSTGFMTIFIMGIAFATGAGLLNVFLIGPAFPDRQLLLFWITFGVLLSFAPYYLSLKKFQRAAE